MFVMWYVKRGVVLMESVIIYQSDGLSGACISPGTFVKSLFTNVLSVSSFEPLCVF